MSEKDQDGRLGRRLLVLRVAGAGAAALVAGTAEAASRQPEQAPGGTGASPDVQPVVTDSDPGDSPGYGRGRGYRGASDSDPYDAPGRGRGGYYRPPPPRGPTDRDPGDSPGYGRGHGYYGPPRRSVTDNDPYDAAGRGRGWR